MVCDVLRSTFTATKSCLGGKSPARTTEEQIAGDLDHKGWIQIGSMMQRKQKIKNMVWVASANHSR
ncbi:hypothetical protein APHNP_0425 [Anaplasma phagocytophilum str. ApNP]|uniref:Uncharacterized protein n=1 Tax=Anaplasma phagocytophilum str. ApNP TaxID=1359153 RepID=A0A0F3NFI7_ANAPH|nr:hypothetical protein APHNP_0425 [Anaplasma phagocytophilum str. ApNP]